MVCRSREDIERPLRRLANSTNRAQPHHQVIEGGQDIGKAPGQRAIIGEDGELHIFVAGGDSLEHGLETDT